MVVGVFSLVDETRLQWFAVHGLLAGLCTARGICCILHIT